MAMRPLPLGGAVGLTTIPPSPCETRRRPAGALRSCGGRYVTRLIVFAVQQEPQATFSSKTQASSRQLQQDQTRAATLAITHRKSLEPYCTRLIFLSFKSQKRHAARASGHTLHLSDALLSHIARGICCSKISSLIFYFSSVICDM